MAEKNTNVAYLPKSGGGGSAGRGSRGRWHFFYADLPGKKRQGKKGKWKRKRRKIIIGKVEKFKMEGGKSMKMSRGSFFFFFFCLCLCFFFFFFFWVLFETTELCLGVYSNGNFYREKPFHAVKKSGKVTLPPPQEKYFSYATVEDVSLLSPPATYGYKLALMYQNGQGIPGVPLPA